MYWILIRIYQFQTIFEPQECEMIVSLEKKIEGDKVSVTYIFCNFNIYNKLPCVMYTNDQS